MRDLLNLLDNIVSEASLAAGEIPPKKLSAVINPKTNKPFTRPELFLHKVKTGSPFTKIDGTEVVINRGDAGVVADWLATGPSKTIQMRTTDGGTVKNTELLKTVEFGSKESENIKIKPSDVFATDPKAQVTDFGNSIDTLLQAGGFPASQMYNKIANNPALVKMGKLGDAVIYMARQANDGQIPVFPPDLKKDEIKAIELYASEYLGALGLVTGAVPFIRGSREQFEEFVGGGLADMIMFFPKASNNPLADSFSVVNDENGHAIKISSKAAGKGAPPALGSMKLPDEVRQKYPDAAEFLDIAQDPGLSQFTQPFAMMNHLYLINPNKVPRAYHQMLPFDPEFVGEIENSMKTGRPLARSVMRNFEKQLSDKVKSGTAADGGKAWYAVTADVMRAVNSDRAVPDLRAALIESLGYNFIQLYTNVKGNQLVTEAFWPAKISGQVKLKTKGSAGEIKGKMSVEISPGGSDIDPGEIPGAEAQDGDGDVADVDTETLDQLTSTPRLKGPGVKAAKDRSEPKTDEKTLGRTKRKDR
jgi:hypothetical protein